MEIPNDQTSLLWLHARYAMASGGMYRHGISSSSPSSPPTSRSLAPRNITFICDEAVIAQLNQDLASVARMKGEDKHVPRRQIPVKQLMLLKEAHRVVYLHRSRKQDSPARLLPHARQVPEDGEHAGGCMAKCQTLSGLESFCGRGLRTDRVYM